MTAALNPRDVGVLDACERLLVCTGLTLAQLADYMHRAAEPPSVPAAVPAALPATDDAPASAVLSPRMAEALRLCDGPEGRSVQELQALMAVSMQTAFGYLDVLHKRAMVTRARPAGVRAARYFRQAMHAQAWCDSQTEALLREQQAADAAMAARAVPARAARVARVMSGPPPACAPVVIRPLVPPVGKFVGEAIVPEHVVPQRIPAGVDMRFMADLSKPLLGGFSACRPGINPLTGKPWEAGR
jgi:hypothetical protein